MIYLHKLNNIPNSDATWFYHSFVVPWSTQVDHKSVATGTSHSLMKDVKLKDVATETLSVIKVSTAVSTENVQKSNVCLQVHPVVVKCTAN